MLVRFIVNNFTSFGEECEFNMLPDNVKSLSHHIIDTPKIKLLKNAIIYGANGAGKSNLFTAIHVFKSIVTTGEVGAVSNYKFKLNAECRKKPIEFEIELLIENKLFIYGIKFDTNIVFEEFLYESLKTKHKIVFHRYTENNTHNLFFSEKFTKDPKNQLLISLLKENLLDKHQLLISRYKELKIVHIENVFRTISNILIITPDVKFLGLESFYLHTDRYRDFANNFLKKSDTGVDSLEIERIKLEKYIGEDDIDIVENIYAYMEDKEEGEYFHKGTYLVLSRSDNRDLLVAKAITKHSDNLGNLIKFELEDESDGTRRLLDFVPAFRFLLRDESEEDFPVILFIDEIDQSLHPTMLKEILQELINHPNYKGQLIFSTHESQLLDLKLFRQDEIWFVEKDQETKSSKYYSMNDFKPRNDLDIRKGYLSGRFGAIPFINNIIDLNW